MGLGSPQGELFESSGLLLKGHSLFAVLDRPSFCSRSASLLYMK